MEKFFYRLTPRRAAANAKFVKACDELARAEEAYRVDKSHAAKLRVIRARRIFAEAKAERLAAREMS